MIRTFLALSLLACNGDDPDTDITPDTDPPVGMARSFTLTIENVSEIFDHKQSGIFNTPDGATDPGPIPPGGSYTITFNAGPGDTFGFASMFAQSNDWFIAAQGVELYDSNGDPMDSDPAVALYDAGTEADQVPGTGIDQAPRQMGPGQGPADTNANVRMADDTTHIVPAGYVSLEIRHVAADQFTAILRNTSTAGDLGGTDVVLTPGVYAVGSPLFTMGSPAPAGLEELAEEGNPAVMGPALASHTGITTPFAPGLVVIGTDDTPMFTAGMADRGEGLEQLAEDGDPSSLEMSTGGTVFNTPTGMGMPGPLMPGASYEVNFDASPGDKLAMATMLIQSNDLFIALQGQDLFDGDSPAVGDLSMHLGLWDAGTEMNQYPGTGWDQAPRQAAAGVGADEMGAPVQAPQDAWDYAEPNTWLRVTLSVE